MNGEEGSQLQKIYDSVIRLEEMMKGVKDNDEIQRMCCEKHEKRITDLEICGGRTKGVYATISAVAVVLTMFVLFLLSKLSWK